MKKKVTIMLYIIIILSVTGCGSNNRKVNIGSSDNNKSNESQEVKVELQKYEGTYKSVEYYYEQNGAELTMPEYYKNKYYVVIRDKNTADSKIIHIHTCNSKGCYEENENITCNDDYTICTYEKDLTICKQNNIYNFENEYMTETHSLICSGDGGAVKSIIKSKWDSDSLEVKEIQKEQPMKEPAVGMTTTEVLESTWGKPDKINKDTYSWGTTEQWVYNDKGYIYFKNGSVTSISER